MAQDRRLPAGVPRCCPHHRLAALDHIDWLLAVDAALTAEYLRDERDQGVQAWDEESIAYVLDGHRRWLHARLDDALDVGEVFWRSAVREAL